MVASGSSCERVTSKDDCEFAAEELGLEATTAEEETESKYPPFCYAEIGGNDDYYDYALHFLYFNNNGSSTAICSGYNMCICKNDGTSSPPPSSYDLVTSGSSCERITSKEECELAAEELGLDATTATEETVSDYPAYCYLSVNEEGEGNLWFNRNGDSFEQCSASYSCICKTVGSPPPPPLPPPPGLSSRRRKN